MRTKRVVLTIVAIGVVAGLTTGGFAQHPPSHSAPSGQASMTPGQAKTIDCPAAAGMEKSATQALSNQPGAGSGLAAMPSVGSPQRVEGAIKTLDSSRTNRLLEVNDVKLEVEPSTVILVGCQPATMGDIKPGAKIKAMYEVKEPNRNVATVIEVES